MVGRVSDFRRGVFMTIAIVNRMRTSTPVALLAVSLIALSSSSACGNCVDTVVATQRTGDKEVAVHHRVCGSVAGYMVSIAPPRLRMDGRADAFEPFMMECDCYQAEATPPVTVRLEGPTRLVVTYDPTRVWHIEKQHTRHGEFAIEYRTSTGSPASPRPQGK